MDSRDKNALNIHECLSRPTISRKYSNVSGTREKKKSQRLLWFPCNIISFLPERLPTSHGALTESRLAMQDVEAVVHAGRQQEVLLGWMPLQPPHAAPCGIVAERLSHVPAIPKQHVLVVAAGEQVCEVSDLYHFNAT